MRTNLLLSVLVLNIFASPGHAQNPIGPVTNPANGHQYYLLNEQVTWNAAEATAITLGGHLATIRSSVEQDWLISFVTGQGLGSGYVWIGLNDRAVEGNFQWTSGDPVLYQNWEAGQPDDQFGEDAVCLSVPNGKWLDTLESFIGFAFAPNANVCVSPRP